MATRYFGAPVTRNEDPRLLAGQALFVDDVELPGLLHAAFYRSPYAHARIKRVDVSRALARPGVFAAAPAADLGEYWQPGPRRVTAGRAGLGCWAGCSKVLGARRAPGPRLRTPPVPRPSAPKLKKTRRRSPA